jgi:hypothetical protein
MSGRQGRETAGATDIYGQRPCKTSDLQLRSLGPWAQLVVPLLLAEALRKAVAAGEAAAARLVVVDAIDDEAAKFYVHYGFIPAPGHPLRFYRRMKTSAPACTDSRHRHRTRLKAGVSLQSLMALLGHVSPR